MITAKVQSATDFKRVVVDEDYKEYKSNRSNRSDLRLCFHLALGLFHLRDWTFWQYSSSANWPYNSWSHYETFLKHECPEFGYMQDLANSVKHPELRQNEKRSTQMVGLANTEIRSAAFQTGAFQGNAFQVQTVIVSETGPSQFVVFEKAADAVMSMWNNLFSSNGWK